jgi:transcriptional/translational regulatory protein YebC/TACO1
VRHAFTKCGGNLGQDGSVGFMFTKLGQICFAPGVDEDRIIEIGLEAGAQDVVTNEDGSIDVLTSPENFSDVQAALRAASLEPANSEVTLLPGNYISLTGDDAEKMEKLIDMLEDLDDVQKVYTNADIEYVE